MGWETNLLPGLVGAGIGYFTGGLGGAALGMGIGNSAGQAMGAQQANQQNIDLAREQMAFQERMSSSAHQREVQDLTKAGLNPILSVNAGASSPTGQTATVQNTAEGLTANAFQSMQMLQAIRKQKSEIDLMNAQTTKAQVDAKVASKGIPEADIKNRGYKLLQPIIEKIEEMSSSGSQKPIKMRGLR